ncbi:2,3,4,5-tetrahydropyridine-2,6-dicarboxylate N-succinyltransferase [Candidatus Endolissoclinum faulkneri L5]|uniref:2,3,4,5-tetrahydropyridine-2,6-dicarboxylate N-succinyltransferase n=2 Tax=Candidatus Endolissoclinum faulkneri TaxID=1263979 RepID=V9TUC3_9PROT|nr:2,3,4,5-tetrahydropyridine-2,6-dicarboxylate N-succinyltransferase [Candidatus Endolissoclinum faulkneri]AHC73747.1 2,3,4,5-tetrahydropyridine-2,6-dicarboxylate N-succinyltransferase [Candidatus Endolissoclinum faulkneri L5]
MNNDLQNIIDHAWENRNNISASNKGEIREAVETVLENLDTGLIRTAQPKGNHQWMVNHWVKKALLLSFQLNDMQLFFGGPEDAKHGKYLWWDKVPLKFSGWNKQRFLDASFRAVPHCVVRYSAHIASGVILMPCFVNVGAFIDHGSMIDAWATVGSCAQIGKNVHISGGAGIGGVLEPMQADPVIVEDNCFIGARSEVVEGVIVEEGAVLSMGVFISKSTHIVNRNTGEVHIGRVPAYSVVVPGSMPGRLLPNGMQGPSLSCAVVIKNVDAQTRSKTSINDLLRY